MIVSSDHQLAHISGGVAAIFSSLSVFPQAYEIYRTGDVSSFNKYFMLMLLVSNASWIVYNTIHETFWGVVSACVWFMFAVFVLYYMKFKPGRSTAKGNPKTEKYKI